MSKKYSLTKHEQKLLEKAQYYQDKASELHRKFAKSLEKRFKNSITIQEFEEWDLWMLNESGDCGGYEIEEKFWKKVKKEEESTK